MPHGPTHPTSDSEHCHTHCSETVTNQHVVDCFKLVRAESRTHDCSSKSALTDFADIDFATDAHSFHLVDSYEMLQEAPGLFFLPGP